MRIKKNLFKKKKKNKNTKISFAKKKKKTQAYHICMSIFIVL